MIFHASEGAGAADTEQGLVTVYSKSELGPTDTAYDVFGRGGAIFIESATQGQDAALVKKTIEDKATIIEIGGFDAAFVESTTLPTGVRSRGVSWSDGTIDYSLRATGSSEEVVRSAQSLYCS